jgi:hypothetical protein
MDVSDIKLLQTIYYILASSVSIRRHMSLYEFRSFLIAELRKQKIRIDLIDEERHLFAAKNKVILFFPEAREDEGQIKSLLLEILIPYSKTILIAYAIQNKNGACVIRFELSDGFVSSHEKGI